MKSHHRLFGIGALHLVLAAGSMLLSSASRAEPVNSSDGKAILEHNREVGKRYFEDVWNKGRVDLLDDLLGADYINHTPSTPNPPPGPAGLKPIFLLREGFPDLNYEIQDMSQKKGRVAEKRVRAQIVNFDRGQ